MPADIFLLKRQFVTRNDGLFHYTRFTQSPLEFPQCELPHLEPLSDSMCLNMNLQTTKVLRECGIYLHEASGCAIVRCGGKGSFCIDLENEFVLQDVIVRRGMYKEGVFDGKTIKKHINGEGDGDGYVLLQKWKSANSVNKDGKLSSVIPLLPVFLGWRHKYGDIIHHVDFTDRGYKWVLRELAQEQGVEFVLAQRTITANGRVTSRVVGLPGVDHAVRHALKRRIDTDHSLWKRVLRYIKHFGINQSETREREGNGEDYRMHNAETSRKRTRRRP